MRRVRQAVHGNGVPRRQVKKLVEKEMLTEVDEGSGEAFTGEKSVARLRFGCFVEVLLVAVAPTHFSNTLRVPRN